VKIPVSAWISCVRMRSARIPPAAKKTRLVAM
jgi:hypothetical protein